MIGSRPPLAPFVAALGEALDQAAPSVRKHLTVVSGYDVHQGVIRRMWRRGPLGAAGGRVLHLDSRQAIGARFELRNELVFDPQGGSAMVWRRTHYLDTEPIVGVGLVRWDASRRMLIDEIGVRKWLEVELTAILDEGAVTMRSGRQWLRILGCRLPLPRWLVGSARTREWEEPDGRLGLSLILHHPLFGDYAGYEAVLASGSAS